MRHLNSIWRLQGGALITLLLLALVLPAPPQVAAGAAPTHAADQSDKDNRDDKGDKKDGKGSKDDPCRKALKRADKGKGELPPECQPVSSGGAARGDFNGDGVADLAVGAPYEDEDGVGGVGAVNIIYGSSTGLTAASDQYLTMSTFGYTYQSNANFGWALAAGDFNGDDFSDLAIGMPGLDLTGSPDHGTVVLINGSADGLDTFTERTLSTLAGVGGRKGAALVWADFNADGFGDLAVGIPDAEVRGDGFACSGLGFRSPKAGEVQVFYGSGDGLRQLGAQRFRQGVCSELGIEGIGDSVEEGDRFGSSLAVLNHGDGNAADLVIGAPYEDLGLVDKIDAGVVHILEGLPDSGLTDTHIAQVITQDTAGVGGGAESGDYFGLVLATGDFNGDGDDDLAVGIPWEDLISNTEADGGAVQVFFGDISASQIISAANDLFISQSNLPGSSVEAGDRFGWALAVGRFDGDNFDDLAIGVPREDIGTTLPDAGMVQVLYGSSSGPSFTRVQNWHQDISGIEDVAEPGDHFGYALSAWNFGRDGRADLAIGVPFEDRVSVITDTLQPDAGAVVVIYGTANGLSATAANAAQFWTQDSPNINGTAQVGDRFGNSLY